MRRKRQLAKFLADKIYLQHPKDTTEQHIYQLLIEFEEKKL